MTDSEEFPGSGGAGKMGNDKAGQKDSRCWQWEVWSEPDGRSQELAERGEEATFVNARFIKPLDYDLLRELTEEHVLFVTMEENVHNGGFGEQVTAWMKEQTAGGSDQYIQFRILLWSTEVWISCTESWD